jgi:nucleoside-diphosphate-sugar epimerase
VHDRARLAEVRTLLCDASKAARLLSWRPAVTFQAGLSRNIEWELDRNRALGRGIA